MVRKSPKRTPRNLTPTDQKLKVTAPGLETTDPNITHNPDGSRVVGTASGVVNPRAGTSTHVRTPKGVEVAVFSPHADANVNAGKTLPAGHTVYTMTPAEAALYEGNNNNGERDGVLQQLRYRFEGRGKDKPTTRRTLTPEEASQLDPYLQANRTGLLDDVLNPPRAVPYSDPAVRARARIDPATGLPYPDSAYRERANPVTSTAPKVGYVAGKVPSDQPETAKETAAREKAETATAKAEAKAAKVK